MYQPTHVSVEIWRRIRVAVWAYAYEIRDNPLVSDAKFDKECLLVNKDMRTSYHGRNNDKIDRWFSKNFRPNTGRWVHRHPDLDGIRRYYKLWKTQNNYAGRYGYYELIAQGRKRRLLGE